MKQYYYIIWGLIIITATSFFLYNQHAEIKKEAIAEIKQNSSLHVLELAARFVKSEDFVFGNKERAHEVFGNFWNAIQSPEITRLKVWDNNFTILWSNLPELIGQRFPENYEVAEALEGEIEFEEVIETKNRKDEYFFERQYTGLGELYVPFADANGKIVGVVETYQSLYEINQKIRQDFLNVSLFTITGALILFILGSLALRFLFKAGTLS